MIKTDFIKVINEEIASFDFLSNDELLKEQEVTDLLQDPDLQKQFICDALLDRNGKVKTKEIADSYIRGNWDETDMENADRLTLVYSVDVEYRYDMDKEPLVFNLYFNADKIDIGVDGWQDDGDGWTNPPEGEAWYDQFEWGDVGVTLQTTDGDEIEFTAFNQAPPRIQTLFMRHWLEGFIENETLEIRTTDKKDNIQNIQYC